jgi:hypothetical protein
VRLKVRVDSNLHISRVFEPPLELDLEGGSHILQKVLEVLANRCKNIHFLRDDGEVGGDIDTLLLNGRPYSSLSQELRTLLKDRDEIWVEVYMEPLGGG